MKPSKASISRVLTHSQVELHRRGHRRQSLADLSSSTRRQVCGPALKTLVRRPTSQIKALGSNTQLHPVFSFLLEATPWETVLKVPTPFFLPPSETRTEFPAGSVLAIVNNWGVNCGYNEVLRAQRVINFSQ